MHKTSLHLDKSPTGPYLENVFRAKLVYKDNTDYGIMHKKSGPSQFKAQQGKRRKKQRT